MFPSFDQEGVASSHRMRRALDRQPLTEADLAIDFSCPIVSVGVQAVRQGELQIGALHK